MQPQVVNPTHIYIWASQNEFSRLCLYMNIYVNTHTYMRERGGREEVRKFWVGTKEELEGEGVG